MCRQVILTGLAAAVLLSGCILRKEEPVAQQKSVGDALDKALRGKHGLDSLVEKANKVSELIEGVGLTRGLREDQFIELVETLVVAGSRGIINFKKKNISKIFYAFSETCHDISRRLATKTDAWSQLRKAAFNWIPGEDIEEVAAFLKKHTDIADDKIFVRLVERLDKLFDDVAEAVVANHLVADAIGVELASDSKHYGLKSLGISPQQMVSELKASSADFRIDDLVFAIATKTPTDGFNLIRELMGVDVWSDYVYMEVLVLRQLLTRGEDGEFAYKLDYGKNVIMNRPFDKKFTKPIISGKYSGNYSDSWSTQYLREFYKGN